MNFAYTCKTADGTIQKGTLDAGSETEASKILLEKQYFVLELHSEEESALKKSGLQLPFIGKKVSLKDRIIFTQQLAMMVKAGLPLIDAFKALEEQTDNQYFSGIIHQIADEVKGGRPLSATLAKFPKVFNTLYVASVGSGEKSGQLDEVLQRLSDQLQKDYDLISKIKAAVSYPILVVGALIGIVILMMLFVIPQLKAVFSDMGVELPLITRIILGSSDVLRGYWYIAVLVIVGTYLGIKAWGKTPAGRLIIDKTVIRIPVIGALIKKIYLTRFARTMGTLVASGLPMLEIVSTVKSVITNKVYQMAFENVYKDIESGLPLSQSLRKQKVFPPMIYHLVSVGEKSGKIDYVLLSMANFFDREVENQTSSLATFIEPILIILIGGGVGLVIASVLMPIYSLVNVI